jgi:hypothetical protein
MFQLRRNRIRTIIIKITVFFTFLFILQASISFFWIRYSNIKQISADISWLNNRIASDLVFKNNKWDTSIYSADPLTPHPDGTGGFPDPVYIISADGFVLERNALIHGLLDSGSLSYLSQFETAQTVSGPTDEQRRVLSRTIMQNGTPVGVVAVSRVIHGTESLDEVDSILLKNLNNIISKIQLQQSSLDVSLVKIQAVDYNIAFEIVDKYNNVLLSNGRVPSYIDRSYISEQIKNPQSRIIKDTQTGEQFLIQTKVLKYKNTDIGIIVHGKSLNSTQKILWAYITSTFLTYIIILLPVSLITFYLLRRELATIFTMNDNPSSIIFNRLKAQLTIDNETINLEQNSNQFMLCTILFSNVERIWPQEILLKKMNIDNWRSLYDAALSINKKIRFKLILHENKAYLINPSYAHMIKNFE